MVKKSPSFFLFFSFILILTSNLYAADDFRIAVIDFKEFIEQSEKGKSINKEIQDKKEELRSELEKIQAELKRLQERFQREASLWTQERKQEEERSFRVRINEFNKAKVERQKELAEFQGKRISEAKKEIIAYAEEKAKDAGYYLIIEKQTGSILYAKGSIDITGELIQKIGDDSNQIKKY